MNAVERRFVFGGHAIGAAAQFHRLDDTFDLDHVVPTLGPAVLAGTGGVSESSVHNYCFSVDKPRKRNLFAVRKIESRAHGRKVHDGFETHVESTLTGASVVEKLHVENVHLNLKASHKEGDDFSSIVSRGNAIDGLSLGPVQVRVHLDEEPFFKCGTKDQLAEFYSKQSDSYRQKNHWRFNTPPDSPSLVEHRGRFVCSLVEKIELSGPDNVLSEITVDGYTIIWEGFGRIILGEVLVRERDRRVTMIRLKMGSDAGGDGSLVDGQSSSGTMP